MPWCGHNPAQTGCISCERVAKCSATRIAQRRIDPNKPKVSINELAAKRKRCGQAKAAGRPCTEFDVGRKIKWTYGITTVPSRKDVLLPQTITSLRAAGFDTPRLFVDGTTPELEAWYRSRWTLPMTFRSGQPLKAYGNWALALAELLIREPVCERYAIFQDDIVVGKNLRDYLDSCPYPDKGYWNLLTFASNDRIAPPQGGWFEAHLCNGNDPRRLQTGRGAAALVFSREGVTSLLGRYEVIGKPTEPGDRAWKRIDGCVVNAMNNAGWREWVHSPSLIGHTGVVSTVGNEPHRMAGRSFMGEQFDLLTLKR